MKPRSPSKIGAGPVMPSAASRAAKTPLRAALAKAQPFHMLSSPERVCRSATLQTPAMPMAWVDLRGVELHQLAGGERRRDGAVGDVIDAVLAQAGGVAEPALDLVGQHRGGDHLLAGCLRRFADGKHRREVVAGMGRLQRQVGVVVVEVADEQAVDERRPLGAAAPPPSSVAPGLPCTRRAHLRAIGKASAAMAPTAVANESMKRRLASCTTGAGRSS